MPTNSKEYARRYRQQHKEQIAQYYKDYRKRNADKIAKRMSKYQKENRAAIRSYQRAYYAAKRERDKEETERAMRYDEI